MHEANAVNTKCSQWNSILAWIRNTGGRRSVETGGAKSGVWEHKSPSGVSGKAPKS